MNAVTEQRAFLQRVSIACYAEGRALH